MNEILGATLNGLVLLATLSVVAGFLRSSTVKGWFGEAQGALAKQVLLGPEYTTFNNVTIPTRNGTTQIDHVVVSKFGLFVVEAKNMKGWIFGDEKSPQWTQSIYGRKFRFQNPLHQNYRHVRALTEFLGIDEARVHSVVMFWGDAQFKTPMPPNVLTSGYTSHIRSRQRVVFSAEEVSRLIAAIQSGSLPKTRATRDEHIASLKARHSSTTMCPKCAAELVLRTARTGPNAGRKFYGCLRFPACRYTRDVHESSAGSGV